MNFKLLNQKLTLIEHLLMEKGNNVSYSNHSTQINLEDCISKKDYGFHRTQKMVPKESIYRSLPQVEQEVLGSKVLKDHPDEEYGLETTPHITALYGLTKEDDYFKIRKMLSNVGEVPFKIGNISSFRNPETPYDVLLLKIHSPKLHKIHNAIKSKFDNVYSFPEYKPHMTLAYVKKGHCKDLEGPCNWTGQVYKAPKMQFSHNDGYYLDVPFIG